MNQNRTPVFRSALRGAGCIALAVALLLLHREQLIQGFLLAFCAFTLISVAETAISFEARHTTRSFLASLSQGRSHRSTLGTCCEIVSWFCLAAACMSWVALR